ncbi:SGNH/GDSL hydrolase family protein [Nocardia pseudovaccinii]|uniref:SGNH/GDSL hydrolase family protein n=1 Tax=Nocardia pseudovaccinii TaxID=189540 RepID=UPI000ADE28D0|nr:SGNH/GDSL hydrolase family protein [Nocardia pseudovaccinii]
MGVNAELIEKLIRFQRPERVLPYLDELDDIRIASLFGLDPAEYKRLRAGFDAQVHTAATELLANPEVADAVDRLPFEPGQHVVAIGGSTTADRLSWFEIMRALLAIRRPDGIRLSNLAVSGCTTTQALAALSTLTSQRPDWVLCHLGANDAKRLGGIDGPRLVSLLETNRNLLLLHDSAMRDIDARWIWLTPAAVDEAKAAAVPHFQRAGIAWRTSDMADAAGLLADQPEPIVDVFAITTPDSGFDGHLDDGVHLTGFGQQEISAAVVVTLAQLS